MKEKKEPTLQGLTINRTVDGEPESASGGSSSGKKRGRRRSAKASKQAPGGASLAQSAKLRSDPYLWGLYIIFIIYSVVESYSASSSEIVGNKVFGPLISHVGYLLLGFLVLLIFCNIHYKYYRKYAWWFGALAVGLMIWAANGGVMINGAQRAVRIAGFTVQPPEIAKLALVVVLAKVIAKNQMHLGITNKGMFIALAVTAVFCLLLFRNGFTNTFLIVVTAFCMLVIGGLQIKKILVLMLLGGVAAAGVGYFHFKSDDSQSVGTATEATAAGVAVASDASEQGGVDRSGARKGRIESYLRGVSPTDTLNDNNRQVIYSNMAQARGGVLGNGPGNSRESARLPLAFSDYIFSIIIEDVGFVGASALLVFYLCLVGRAGRIAVKCRKAFPALLILGCAVMIVVQALVHMAIVVGIAPVSGQPLPFISMGGTSVIVMSAAMGMMLSVSKYAVQTGRKQEQLTKVRQAVAGGEEPDNPTMIKATSSSPDYGDEQKLTYQ